MEKARLNNFGWSTIVKRTIVKKKVVPENLTEHVATQKITHDFILELYEKSKKFRGKKRAEMISVAEKLSKHVGQWLVEK